MPVGVTPATANVPEGANMIGNVNEHMTMAALIAQTITNLAFLCWMAYVVRLLFAHLDVRLDKLGARPLMVRRTHARRDVFADPVDVAEESVGLGLK